MALYWPQGWKKDTMEFGRPICSNPWVQCSSIYISNNKPKMLKVGPKRQAFCALTPSVKWALQYKQSRQTMVETGGATGEEIPPFRGSLLMTCEAYNQKGLAFKGESRQPSWELRSHSYLVVCRHMWLNYFVKPLPFWLYITKSLKETLPL